MSARVVVVGDRRAAEPAPGDVVLDLAPLVVALGGGSSPHARHVALRALRAAREAAVRLREDITVWDVRPGQVAASDGGAS